MSRCSPIGATNSIPIALGSIWATAPPKGEEHVSGQGPFGHVEAAGFRVLDRGATIIFTGKTDLYLEPNARKASQ